MKILSICLRGFEARLWRSVDEIEDGERWQRWETVFACIKPGLPKSKGEPWIYRWRYDARQRVNAILGQYRAMFGRDYWDDFDKTAPPHPGPLPHS